MMSFCRTMILIAAGAALAGCAATAPQRPGSAGPEASDAAGSVAGDAREVEKVVEAKGTVSKGYKDTDEDVHEWALEKAIKHAVMEATGVWLEEIVETEFGVLVKDTKNQRTKGWLSSVTIIPDGEGVFDASSNTYTVHISAKYIPKRVDAGAPRLPVGASPEGQVQTAKTGTPPAASSETVAGSASAPVSRTGEASGAVPAPESAATASPAEQEETAETGPAPAGSVVSSRSREAVTVCCREFPRPLVKRVRNTRSVLERAPGVTRVEEVTATGAELCYRIHHDGSLEPIDEWIEQLRTDAALPFKRRHDRGAGTIDLVFDAGFD